MRKVKPKDDKQPSKQFRPGVKFELSAIFWRQRKGFFQRTHKTFGVACSTVRCILSLDHADALPYQFVR